ncbi:MAG: carboxypeptidase regulatory-like domain-containing protein [Planctomycetes bacterium]|nr:carboxypeptidase regulatory-like domain-containing protein [Planctomycetota bacterium]
MKSEVYYRTTHATIIVAGLIGGCLCIGCGDGRSPRMPVSGTVTYQGKLIEHASVTFFPQGARSATGRTDAEGRFELTTFGLNDGAVEGNYRVTVVKTKITNPADPYSDRVQLLPKQYAKAASSPLSAEVSSGGDNHFVLDLID